MMTRGGSNWDRKWGWRSSVMRSLGLEQEKEEEDREVERIFNESRNTQRKLLKGTNIDMSKQSIQGA